MNRILMGVSVAMALVAGSPAAAATYDAFASFDGTNGSGGFSWVASTTPTATPLSAVSCVINNTICLGLPGASSSLPGVFKSTGIPSTSHPYQPLDRLLIHPGQFAALNGVFVAPTSGAYDFTVVFDALTAGTSVTTSVFTNATGVITPLGTPGLVTTASGPRSFSGTVTLAAGQLIGFNLGNAGDFSSDSTGLRFTVSDAAGAVPEPASWALMIAGFGVIGGAARRRRQVQARMLV